jgi:S-adenosylmethionine-dependent methyltransferase
MSMPFADQLRIALASRWRRFGDPWQLRMRAAARIGELDMRRDPAEQIYASLYIDRITQVLAAPSGLRILDAGCQAGRLAIPLARAGHHVTGLDISADWLTRCRRNCAEAGVTVALVQAGLDDVGEHFEAGSFDAVLCAEVLYTMREPAMALRRLARLLRPGGTLFASHRTRYYMLTTLGRYHLLADMVTVAGAAEGNILGGQYYNWFDQDALQRIYAEAGLRVLSAEGIGTVSGLGIDGMAAVLDPADLDEAGRAQLLEVERACAARFPDTARYRLIVATADPELHPVMNTNGGDR